MDDQMKVVIATLEKLDPKKRARIVAQLEALIQEDETKDHWDEFLASGKAEQFKADLIASYHREKAAGALAEGDW
jgi:hypothetical protein